MSSSLSSQSPGAKGLFSYLIPDSSRQSHYSEGRSAEKKNREHGLLYLRYFENGPLEPGYIQHGLLFNFTL